MEVLSGSSDSSTCRNSSVGFSERSIEPQKDWLIVVLTAIPTLIIVIGTIAGNVLVCVAIGHSRQLRKNITNAFCASLAIRYIHCMTFVYIVASTISSVTRVLTTTFKPCKIYHYVSNLFLLTETVVSFCRMLSLLYMILY